MKINSKIFVAGHRGLLGSSILRRLTHNGYTNILTVGREELDLTVQKSVDDWFEINQPEYVFLAAAKVSGIKHQAENPGESILVNLQIQTNVIDAARRYGCKKFLFPGSNCAYPKFSKLPITEDQILSGRLEPTSEGYAVAKIAGIKMCEHFRTQWGFNAISIMPCNLYGPNDNYDEHHSHVMAAMISKFMKARDSDQQFITLWGDGSALREFVYADDIADAAILCMNEYDSPDPINIASGNEITLRELASIIKTVSGYRGDIIWDTSKPTGTLAKGLEISKITALGWKPQYSLEQGIKETIKWYEANIQ